MAQITNLNSKCLKSGEPNPPQADDVLRIFIVRFSPYAERILFWAARKGIKADVVNINVREPRPDWFLAKNPKGQVPTIEYKGKTAYESGLLLEYVDELFPESRLLPTDPFEKYQLKLTADKLSSTVGILIGFFPVVFGAEDQHESAKEKARAAFAEYEALLKDRYFSGSSPNLPDYLVYPMIHKVKVLAGLGFTGFPVDGFPGAEYPKLAKWFTDVENLPEVKNNQQPWDVSLEFFSAFKNRVPQDYDTGL